MDRALADVGSGGCFVRLSLEGPYVLLYISLFIRSKVAFASYVKRLKEDDS